MPEAKVPFPGNSGAAGTGLRLLFFRVPSTANFNLELRFSACRAKDRPVWYQGSGPGRRKTAGRDDEVSSNQVLIPVVAHPPLKCRSEGAGARAEGQRPI